MRTGTLLLGFGPVPQRKAGGYFYCYLSVKWIYDRVSVRTLLLQTRVRGVSGFAMRNGGCRKFKKYVQFGKGPATRPRTNFVDKLGNKRFLGMFLPIPIR
eukprot:5586508-Amphidinium_carterae.1